MAFEQQVRIEAVTIRRLPLVSPVANNSRIFDDAAHFWLRVSGRSRP